MDNLSFKLESFTHRFVKKQNKISDLVGLQAKLAIFAPLKLCFESNNNLKS